MAGKPVIGFLLLPRRRRSRRARSSRILCPLNCEGDSCSHSTGVRFRGFEENIDRYRYKLLEWIKHLNHNEHVSPTGSEKRMPSLIVTICCPLLRNNRRVYLHLWVPVFSAPIFSFFQPLSFIFFFLFPFYFFLFLFLTYQALSGSPLEPRWIRHQ